MRLALIDLRSWYPGGGVAAVITSRTLWCLPTFPMVPPLMDSRLGGWGRGRTRLNVGAAATSSRHTARQSRIAGRTGVPTSRAFQRPPMSPRVSRLPLLEPAHPPLMALDCCQVGAGIDVVGLAFRFGEAASHTPTGDVEQLFGVQRVLEYRAGLAPDEEMMIVKELDILGGSLTQRERLQRHAGSQVPRPDGAILSRRGDHSPVRADLYVLDHSLLAVEDLDHFPGSGIKDLDDTLIRSAHQVPAVGKAHLPTTLHRDSPDLLP